MEVDDDSDLEEEASPPRRSTRKRQPVSESSDCEISPSAVCPTSPKEPDTAEHVSAADPDTKGHFDGPPLLRSVDESCKHKKRVTRKNRQDARSRQTETSDVPPGSGQAEQGNSGCHLKEGASVGALEDVNAASKAALLVDPTTSKVNPKPQLEHDPPTTHTSPSKRIVRPPSSQVPFPLPSPEKRTSLLADDPAVASMREQSSPESDLPDIAKLIAATRPSSTPVSNQGAKNVTPKPVSKIASVKPKSQVQTQTQPHSKPESQPKPQPLSQAQLHHPSQSQTQDLPLTPGKPRAKRKIGESPSSTILTAAEGKGKSQNTVGSPPSKRVKRAPLPPTKHATYWLLDGTVVVQLQCTQFRLHRSRLVQASAVFAERFEKAADSQVDGHPVYRIENVTVSDFEVLLDAMDKAITFHTNPPSFRTLAALFRSSTVLDFPDYRSYAAARLTTIFSPSLSKLTLDLLPAADAHEAVILGREYGLPGVLKRAFYELLRTGGFGRGNVTDPVEGDDTKQQKSHIQDRDWDKLVQTREQITSVWINDAASSSFECNGPQNLPRTALCLSGPQRQASWVHIVHTSGVFRDYLYDPLCGFEVLAEDVDWAGEGYCKECMKMQRDCWQKAREKMWINLEIWLDLPPTTADGFAF